jgi:hypothetical protein
MRGSPLRLCQQERYSDDARRRFAENRAAELFTREARSRSVRLRNAQNKARRLSLDAAHELRAIDVQIDLLERKTAQRRATLAARAGIAASAHPGIGSP